MVQVDTAVAEETRSAVQAEELKAKVKAQAAQAIADDAQKDLAEALPALDAALASLRNLNKSDVTEVTGLRGRVAELGLVLDTLLLCSNCHSIGLQHPSLFQHLHPSPWGHNLGPYNFSASLLQKQRVLKGKGAATGFWVFLHVVSNLCQRGC